MDENGNMRPHAPVLVQAEASDPNAMCRTGCGLPRGHQIHEWLKPVWLPVDPTTVEVNAPVQEAPTPDTGPDQNEALAAWDAYAAQVRDTIARKSVGYGDAWQAQGYMGNLARVLSKAARLKNMLWREKAWLGTGGEESAEETEAVADTLVDLGALCAFLVANIEEGNRWGK